MAVVVSGRFRPIQGSIQALCVFSGASGLISNDPASLIAILAGGNMLITIVYYASLLIGGLIAMTGEFLQLKQPIIGMSPKQVAGLATGMIIELAGGILISLNLLAYSLAVFASTEVTKSRAITILFIALGVLGRTVQCYLDVRRIKVSFNKGEKEHEKWHS